MERIAASEANFIRRFEISLSGLTEVERQLSEKLVEAAVGIAPIYEEQQNDLFPGANLYPHDATAKEIEEAAGQNPEILSEYTTLKMSGDGKLAAIPYHQQYHQLLEPVVEKLVEAAEICEDQNLKNYLTLRSQSLLDGDYEKSENVWLANPEPTVDIVIGPYDRYIDKLFSRKFAYLAWTGILDREETTRAQKFIDAFLEAYGWQGSPVKARADRTRIFAGLASIGWSANNLPCQSDWREKYGSKITIFLPSFHERFEQRLEALHTLMPSTASLDPDYLEGISRIFLFAHESCHPLIRRKNDEERLKGEYSTISELYCDILGIQNSQKLIGQELSEQEWELMVPTFLALGLSRFRDIQTSSAASAYLSGEATGFNFFLQKNAISTTNGQLTIPSGEKLGESLSELVQELEFLMSEGTYEQAKYLIDKFGNPNSFSQLG